MSRPLLTLLVAGLSGIGVAWAAESGGAAPRPVEIDGVPLELAQEIFQIEILRLPAKSLAARAADPDPDVRRRVALALGRLRDPEGALPLLTALAADADVVVRKEAAFALGQTEGGAEPLFLRWTAEAEPPVRAALAVALGKQGGGTAVAALIRGLDATQGDLLARDQQRAAAAEGLGRLGMRKVEGASAELVARALVDHIGPPVGETRRRAAWALARLGLGAAGPALRARLLELAARDPDADVRAWLTRAWAGVAEGEERAAGLALLVRDADAGVRTAAARALAKGCVPDGPVLLGRLLGDPDHGVRLEAVNAVGTCPGSAPYALLRPVLDGDDPVLAAAALGSLATAKALPLGLPPYLEPTRPLPVRVAAVRALDDRPQLLELALKAPEPSMRSAAVERLLEAPTPAELKALLAAPDPVIATAAADTLRTSPTLAAEGALLARLTKGDLDEAMAATFVRALSALYATGRVRTPDPGAVPALSRWLFLPTLAQEARKLDLVLDLPALPTPHTPRRVPELTEVLGIRSARVFTSEGELRIALRPDVAPYTVWNFATLAEKGFYDGVPFHRVVPDFVVQAGDPRGDGWGGPGWEIPDELNDLPYDRGAVGMALSGPDTGGSQWFVTLSDQPHLEGTYTVFGHLVYGQRNAEAVHQGATIRAITIERLPPKPGS